MSGSARRRPDNSPIRDPSPISRMPGTGELERGNRQDRADEAEHARRNDDRGPALHSANDREETHRGVESRDRDRARHALGRTRIPELEVDEGAERDRQPENHDARDQDEPSGPVTTPDRAHAPSMGHTSRRQ